MRHHDAKFAASELYDTMSQSWKGEFMDFFTEAVDVLAAIVRALSRPDSPEDYFGGCWEMCPVKSRKTVLPLVKIIHLWPPIRAEPGKDSGRQRQIINETAK